MSAAKEGTASIGFVRALLDFLKERNFNLDRLGAESLVADVSDQRIPIARFQELFEQAIVATSDEDLPLKVAQTIRPRHLGVAGYVALTCANLAEAIQVLLRYEQLVDNINAAEAVQKDGHGELHWRPLMASPPPLFMQLSLANWACLARRLTERPDLQFQAHFSFAAPADVSYYTQLFGLPALFEQPATKLVGPIEYLQLPVTLADPEEHARFRAQAEARLREQPGDSEFVRQVKVVVGQGLSRGGVRLEDVAVQLKLSPRALQYRLEERGLRYRDVLDEVRRVAAERYLCDPALSLADTAFLLGYAEQSGFQQAFKRWTGQTPGEYRSRAIAGAS